jgi:hypothetical protein
MVPHRLDTVGGEREPATLLSRHLRPGPTDLGGDQAPSTEIWRFDSRTGASGMFLPRRSPRASSASGLSRSRSRFQPQ